MPNKKRQKKTLEIFERNLGREHAYGMAYSYNFGKTKEYMIEIDSRLFPKKYLDDETGDRLRYAILNKKNDDIKSIVDNYDVTVFSTIQEVRIEQRRNHRFDTCNKKQD